MTRWKGYARHRDGYWPTRSPHWEGEAYGAREAAILTAQAAGWLSGSVQAVRVRADIGALSLREFVVGPDLEAVELGERR